MSEVTIRIPTPLRTLTAGAAEVLVEAGTVREALDALGRSHDGLLERVLDGDGELRGFVNVFVGSKNVRVLGGLGARIERDAVISIVPAVAGGVGRDERGER